MFTVHRIMMIVARIGILLLLVAAPLLATVYVYWTRTPQYALLHVLTAEAPGQAVRYLERDEVKKLHLAGRREREPFTTRMADLQNFILANGYGVRIEPVRDVGRTSVLHVGVNGTVYQLTFHEQPDGRWKLQDFPMRTELVRDVSAKRRGHPFFLFARL